MQRRNFVKRSAQLSLLLSAYGLNSCSEKKSPSKPQGVSDLSRYKLSLAQWSLHKNIEDGLIDPLDFASMAKDLGFEGVEYVSQLYQKQLDAKSTKLEGMKWLSKEIKKRSDDLDMTNVLVMVDVSGLLGDTDKVKRKQAVLDHYPWIDLASEIGCKSMRINMFGSGDKDEMFDPGVESLNTLCEYGKDKNISLLIENHGGPSSDPHWVGKMMETVDKDNCGTLPDFGNFCMRWTGGTRWQRPCEEEFPDAYEGIALLMPYAGGVSAKSYDFDDKGDETKIDYYKMMDVIDKSDFRGFIGVEFEADNAEEEIPGIKATKKLLEKIMATQKE